MRKKRTQLLMMSGRATVPWYLSGGIAGVNCLGAWQPKGAASYAASKISLVNPSASNLLVDGAAFPTWAAGTGWTFAAASSQYLTIASAIATAAPLSFVCNFYPNAVTASYMLIAICDFDAACRFVLQANGDLAGDPIVALTFGSATRYSSTTSGFVATTWQTAIGVYASSASRASFLNGTNKGTDTNDETPTNLDRTYVGTRATSSTLGSFFDGNIAACAIYNIGLSDVQVLAISNAMALL